MAAKYTLVERAYLKGQSAYARQQARSNNPFHCATSRQAEKYWAWFRGWDAAKAKWKKQTDASFRHGIG